MSTNRSIWKNVCFRKLYLVLLVLDFSCIIAGKIWCLLFEIYMDLYPANLTGKLLIITNNSEGWLPNPSWKWCIGKIFCNHIQL